MTGKNSQGLPKHPDQTTYKVISIVGLLDFLLAMMKGKSRNKIKSFLAHRQVTVDGNIITQFDHMLQPGQHVSITHGIIHGQTPYYGLKIIFEDSYIILIDKQHGLLSIATETEKDKTAYSILSRHVKKESTFNKIFVVHRLDRETSGLMMFAKNQQTKELLQKGWQNIVHERNYIAVVEGSIEKDEGIVSSWLKESNAMTMYSDTKSENSSKAITHYRVLKKNKDYTLLDISLETGKKNQIRIHMKELGHSIIGDIKYGGNKSPIKRLGLHAQKLSFRHPVTKADLSFESPIPRSFLRLF
jgi:23S rRNA pseudouridine1911/1915/1917 synthase